MPPAPPALRALAALLLVGIAGTAPAAAETHRVAPGESIQAAIDAAAPGDVLAVAPGVYAEALEVATPGLTLRGRVEGEERPVLDGRGELDDGLRVTAGPFRMTGFRVRRYRGSGVVAQGVEGGALTELVLEELGGDGLRAIGSRDLLLRGNRVARARGAAIRVEACEGALVASNALRESGTAIALERTRGIELRENRTSGNGAGILVAAPLGDPEARGAAEAASLGADALVRIRGMRFHPRRLTVSAGDTVAWRNEGAVTHTVTSGEGEQPTHSPLSSAFLRPGEHFAHTFEEPGRYEYLCLPHRGEAAARGATVTVEEEPSAEAARAEAATPPR